MYIFELIAKLKFRKKASKKTEEPLVEEEKCRHILVPIDSTKKILACSKCGFLIKRSELPQNLRNKNIFE